MSKKSDFIENVERKKWDLDEYEKRAQSKFDAEANEAAKDIKVVVKKSLQRRDFQVDLRSQLGKFQVITDSTPESQKGGFYCEHCEVLLKDSKSYLDHLNGKKHQKKLGMTMRPERATLQQVRDRLKTIKEQTETADPKAAMKSRLEEYEARLEQRRLEKKAEKARRREEKRKRQAEQQAEHEKEAQEEEALAKRRKTVSEKVQVAPPPGIRPPPGIKKKLAAPEVPEVPKSEEKPQTEEDMMAAMGFNFSFGGSKKNT